MRTLTLLLVFILAGACLAEGTPGALNVRDFGAKGDGKTDDTSAFQKALDACANLDGGIVEVPAGKYLIKTHLAIPPAVTLEGTWRAPASVNEYHKVPGKPESGPDLKGSVLLAVEGAGNENGTPFITLDRCSTIKGVTVFYPEQTKTNPPKAYPWCIATVGADNCSIVDCLLVNPYQAVDFGSRVSGRHFIRNLYAQPLHRGVWIDYCIDIGRIENVHLWPFWTAGDPDSPVGKFMLEQGEAFIFGRSDWQYVTNCFAISYRVGMKFVRGQGTGPYEGAGNYLLTQSGADACDIAVLVEETQGHSGVSFSNSQIFGDIIVKNTNVGMIRFTGCGIFGSEHSKNNIGAADISGRGRVSFDNCHFYCIDRGIKADDIIRVRQGRISVTNCVFLNMYDAPFNQRPIVLDPGVRAAVITGNEFYGPGTVVSKAEGSVIVNNNIENTEFPPLSQMLNRRPEEEPGAIVVDDADGEPGAVFAGEWHAAPNAFGQQLGYFKGTRWAYKGGGSAKAVFTPEVPEAGRYAVYAFFGPDPGSDHATNAPIEIKSADGAKTTAVDLRKTNNQWIELGVYRFSKGRSGSITFTNNADGNVLADAVKLVPAR